MSEKNKSLVPKEGSAVAEFDPKSQREIVRGLADIEKNATLGEVEELIRKGADVNAEDKFGRPVLMLAAGENENPEVIQVLISNGADVNAKNKDGGTALDIAYYSGKAGLTVLENYCRNQI